MKTKSHWLISLPALAIFLFACRHPVAPVPVTDLNSSLLRNIWETTASTSKTPRYLDFTDKQICRAYYSDENGFTSFVSLSYTSTESSITMSIPGISQSATTFSYQVNAQNLFLRLDGKDTLVLKSTSAKPGLDWTEINALEQIDTLLGTNYEGLAFDGTNVWGCDLSSNEMIKVDLAAKTVTRLWDKGLLCSRFEFVNGYIYRAGKDDNTLYYHGPNSDLFGDAVFTFGSAIKGIAYVPSDVYIWCYCQNGDLYKFQKNAKKVMASFNVGQGFTEVKWFDGKLLMVRGEFIYQFDPETKMISKAYHLGNIGTVYGMTPVTNGDIWLNVDGTSLKRIRLY